MENIIDSQKYKEKEEYYRKNILDNKNIPNNEKISLCEEFLLSEFAKKQGNSSTLTSELVDLYYKEGHYEKVFHFVCKEFRDYCKDDSDWLKTITGVSPWLLDCAIRSLLKLGQIHSAKQYAETFLDATSSNYENLPNVIFFKQAYAMALDRCIQIAIIEKNYSLAIDYFSNSILFDEECRFVDTYYYFGKINMIYCAERKDVQATINAFEFIIKIDPNSDDYTKDDKEAVVNSYYYLGMIYAHEIGYINKEKAKMMFNKAKDFVYLISDKEIKENLDKEITNLSNSFQDNQNKVNKSEKSSGGCYVATAVYGSYDCPEVWTLRRFRDDTLAETWYGRAFVKTYYAISPTLVKWFGHTEWFKKMWRGTLDRMVTKLQTKGFESTPYEDKNW